MFVALLYRRGSEVQFFVGGESVTGEKLWIVGPGEDRQRRSEGWDGRGLFLRSDLCGADDGGECGAGFVEDSEEQQRCRQGEGGGGERRVIQPGEDADDQEDREQDKPEAAW